MTSEFAVIFDMDGVMVNSNPYHKLALREFCHKHGHQLSDEQLRSRIYGRTNRDWLTNLFGPLPEPVIRRYGEEKEQLFRDLFGKAIQPLSGLKRFLMLLEERGIPKAIATSAPRANVDFTLEHTGLGKFFTTILDESHVSRGKPDPEIYLKAAQALGYPPEKTFVFEDSLSGVQAAKAAGAHVIGVSTTHSRQELAGTRLVIEDFTQIEIRDLERLTGILRLSP
jgi:HAD superfamily hydrolase (TIGR01509 family)